MAQRSYWLINERVENWEADEANDFRMFGIPDHKWGIAERIAVGDVLVTYVSSGISAFADARRVESKAERMRRAPDIYDTPYPITVRTKPLVVVVRASWVKIHGLVQRLAFTRSSLDWRQVMRFSIRPLE